jgi:hypothetical protein
MAARLSDLLVVTPTDVNNTWQLITSFERVETATSKRRASWLRPNSLRGTDLSDQNGRWALIVHGGAKEISPEEEEENRAGCLEALAAGQAVLEEAGQPSTQSRHRSACSKRFRSSMPATAPS